MQANKMEMLFWLRVGIGIS